MHSSTGHEHLVVISSSPDLVWMLQLAFKGKPGIKGSSIGCVDPSQMVLLFPTSVLLIR